jgi:hypothetical protein
VKTKITIATLGMGGHTDISVFGVTKCMPIKTLQQPSPYNKRAHTDKTAPQQQQQQQQQQHVIHIGI